MSEQSTTPAPVPAKAASSNRQTLLAAAVAGTLTVQPQPATAKDGGRAVGKVTGLPSILAWAYRFAETERLATAGHPRRTDDQVLELMLEDFPENESACFRKVAFQRAYYNSGKGTGGLKPKVQAFVPAEKAKPTPAATPKDPEPKTPAPVAKQPTQVVVPAKPKAEPKQQPPGKRSTAELKAAVEARRKASENAAVVSAA